VDEWPSQYSFVLPFQRTSALVLFRVRSDDPAAIGAELAAIVADELHLDPVEPRRFGQSHSGVLDGRLPSLRLEEVRARRPRLIRQILMSDTPQGRCPVGLIHPVGFWVMFPCDTRSTAERIVDRLSP